VKNQDSLTKILDMVPDFVNKFSKGKDKDQDVSDKVNDILDSQTYGED